jgi:hypothetical protein
LYCHTARLYPRTVRISAKLIAPVVERDFAAGFDWVIEALKQPPAHASPEGGASGTGLGSLNPALALHHHQQRGSGMSMGMGGGSAAAAAAAALGTYQRGRSQLQQLQHFCK